MIRKRCVACLCVLFAFCIVSAGQASPPGPAMAEPDELQKAVNKLQVEVPKWRAIVSAIDLESLQIQYKDGKQIEFLKSDCLGKLDTLAHVAASLRKNVTGRNAVQLLLDVHDAEHSVFALASGLMVQSMDEKQPSHTADWSSSLVDVSTAIMEEEKWIEVPVMTLVAARDAVFEIQVQRLTAQ